MVSPCVGHFSGCNTIMILNSLYEGTSQYVETVRIDPPNNFTLCQSLSQFPQVVRGTFGSLAADSNSPIVCGGVTGPDESAQCFVYNHTVVTFFKICARMMHGVLGWRPCTLKYPFEMKVLLIQLKVQFGIMAHSL